MFDFKRALASVLETHPHEDLIPLMTPWGEKLDPDRVWLEYPRPQMQRDSYHNLNGWWECAFSNDGDGLYAVPESLNKMPLEFDRKILVPFSPEAILSQVQRQLKPFETLWYKRTVSFTAHPRKRVLLHFEAVDYACSCFVNGQLVGMHHGAYAPFSFDITEALEVERLEEDGQEITFEIVVAVKDPSEEGCQPRGKQRLEPGTVWYTAQSGIWQTVWMEEVPCIYIDHLEKVASPDNGTLTVRATLRSTLKETVRASLSLEVYEPSDATNADSVSRSFKDKEIVELTLTSLGVEEVTLELSVSEPHLWSPDDPCLYDISVGLFYELDGLKGHDEVKSYCAFRTISVEPAQAFEADHGIQSDKKIICLNHEPCFMSGILDQGYWPDGLMTAPSEEAFEYDIKLAKSLGFNMMRKHIKTENARWYYLCDKMGMLVWQDTVNGGAREYSSFYTSKLPTVFPWIANHLNDEHDQWRFGIESDLAKDLWIENTVEMVEYLREFPSIIGWTVFNEAWGQFDARKMTALMHELDDTRLFDQTSGWCDQNGGDLISDHNYFRDITVPKARFIGDTRAPFISEFGGYAHYVVDHCSAPHVFGYAVIDELEDFNDEVSSMLAKMDALRTEGLAGYVYTQLSDIEEEVNGLVTYDRRIVKYQK